MGPHSGVEQQQPVRVIHQVPEAGLDPGAPGARFLRRPDEMPEIDAAHHFARLEHCLGHEQSPYQSRRKG